MNYAISSPLFTLGLFLGMLLLLEVGRRIGVRRIARDTERAVAGVGAVEGAIFALLGLLVAFTFSGAAARFDTRRQLIIEETNAIGTAYLRLDLLSADAQRSSPSFPGKLGSRRGTSPGLGACGRRYHGLFVQVALSPQAAELLLFKFTEALLAPAVTDPDQDGKDEFYYTAFVPQMRNNLGPASFLLKGALR